MINGSSINDFAINEDGGQDIAVIEESLTIASAFRLTETHRLTESLAVSDTVSARYVFIDLLVEALSVSDSVGLYTGFIENITESLSVSDVLASRVNYIELINESLLIGSISTPSGAAYIALVFSPENQSITTYDNFPFDGSTNFNGKTLFFNSTGLYEYGGTTDAGATIRAKFQTPKMNFGTQQQKRIPKMWIANDKNAGRIVLKVVVDETITEYYASLTTVNGLAVDPFKLGRGYAATFWQFEVISDGCNELSIESLEFEPFTIQRRI